MPMFRDRDDKWTRERGFWEANRGDIVAIAGAVFFLILFIGGLVFLLGPWRMMPPIPGLSTPMEPEQAAPAVPSPDQKFHYSVPGESEVLIYPAKPRPQPAPGAPNTPPNR